MINKLTTEILEKIISEIKKKENLLKIHKNVINPIIYCIFKELFPYLIFIFSFFIIIVILLILILIKLIKL